MFLNVKLQRLCKSHHLQCIISSKDSAKLGKSLCIRDMAEDLCWMVFGPPDYTASLIGMNLSLTLLNGPRNTSRNHKKNSQHFRNSGCILFYSILFYYYIILYYIIFCSILFYSILFILVCSIMNVVNSCLCCLFLTISCHQKFVEYPLKQRFEIFPE